MQWHLVDKASIKKTLRALEERAVTTRSESLHDVISLWVHLISLKYFDAPQSLPEQECALNRQLARHSKSLIFARTSLDQ